MAQSAAKVAPSRPLRIGLLQFTPVHSDPAASRAKVEALCKQIPRGSLDILVAPEMCLTGYMFESLKEASKLCEDVNDWRSMTASLSEANSEAAHTGTDEPPATMAHSAKALTLDLAASLSKRIGCYTIMGFPEVEVQSGQADDSTQRSSTRDGSGKPGVMHRPSTPFDSRPASSNDSKSHEAPSSSPRYYNAAVLTGRDGSYLHVFRKHFLFAPDERWCSEGAGFQYIDLPDLGRICVAICMDLNPYRFESPFDSMELASWVRKAGADVLVCPMAWAMSAGGKRAIEKDEERNGHSLDESDEEADLNTVNYWATRCMPLFSASSDSGGEDKDERTEKATLFVACNRTGSEGETTYAGSSSVLRMKPGDRPELLARMGRSREGLLLFEVDPDESEGGHGHQ